MRKINWITIAVSYVIVLAITSIFKVGDVVEQESYVWDLGDALLVFLMLFIPLVLGFLAGKQDEQDG